jgi:hypothetical protein
VRLRRYCLDAQQRWQFEAPWRRFRSKCSQYSVKAGNAPTAPLNNKPNSVVIFSQFSAGMLSLLRIAWLLELIAPRLSSQIIRPVSSTSTI